MKWSKKKRFSTSSSRSFLISQVLPTSWLAKFKQMSVNSDEKRVKVKQRGNWDSVATNNSSKSSAGGAKFYSGDDDAFWRLSFEGDAGLKNRAVLKSGRYNSYDNADLEFPSANCHSCRSKATRFDDEEAQKFSDMVSNVRRIRGLPKEVEFFPEMQTCTGEKRAEIRSPRIKIEREKKFRNQRQFDEKRSDGRPFEAEKVRRKASVKNTIETKPGRTDMTAERDDFNMAAANLKDDGCISPLILKGSRQRIFEEESPFAVSNERTGFSAENFSYEWQKLKEKKIDEVKLKNGEQRKSLYISRELQRKRTKQNSRVRVNSPRTASKAEICKIKALEDMKKARLKMKKKAEDEEFQGLDSFAVVKCSYDPEKDFRKSMIEMIKEQNINQPEELEELLACYLTLNSDEFHDLIIRVFRQVWYELNCFDTERGNRVIRNN